MTMHERMDSIADLLVAGGLRGEEQVEAERHAAECSSCSALLRDAREFSTWAKGMLKPDGPPADLEGRVIERFRGAGQTRKRRFIMGTRVLKMTGSIAAAVGLIFLGNLANVQPAVDGKDMHVHFTLDHDAHDHPADASELGALKGRGLSAAESDFRATGRDWNRVNDFWTGDVKALFEMTSVVPGMPLPSGAVAKEFEAMPRNAWGLGLHTNTPGTFVAGGPELLYEQSSRDGVTGGLAPAKIIEERLVKAETRRKALLRREDGGGAEEART
ncbi:MAG TPA: hypothetical protein VG457_16515, partial [Planctomycetota bacterium]|nr:hypothetical protein [Planctomycetota bacterium]